MWWRNILRMVYKPNVQCNSNNCPNSSLIAGTGGIQYLEGACSDSEEAQRVTGALWKSSKARLALCHVVVSERNTGDKGTSISLPGGGCLCAWVPLGHAHSTLTAHAPIKSWRGPRA